jgi:hypothetical protein
LVVLRSLPSSTAILISVLSESNSEVRIISDFFGIVSMMLTFAAQVDCFLFFTDYVVTMVTCVAIKISLGTSDSFSNPVYEGGTGELVGVVDDNANV